MRALLDTHSFLWWVADDKRLSVRARDAIADRSNLIFFSAVSGWEIAEKVRLGRLHIGGGDPEIFVPQQVSANRFEVLSLRLRHALHLHGLPLHHKDPFDRMLIAQAQLEDLVLVTADREISRYPVHIVW